MCQEKKWIWQQEHYPNFTFDNNRLSSILADIKYHQGLLNGIYQTFNKKDLLESKLEIFSKEAIETSKIEGEILSRDSVRSSLAKKLSLNLESEDKSTIHTDGLIDVLLDARQNSNKSLTLSQLFGWHNSLFPTGYSGLHKINVAKFRGKEPMQIVSGAIGREKVHYIAPPHKQLEKQMKQYLSWLNKRNSTIIDAGIAHLWFVIIHPFDDGNGRLARAITDHVLMREAKQKSMLYSFSQAILQDRKRYYDILEQTTKGKIDITNWLKWFLKTLLKALILAKEQVNFVLQKTKFWDKHRNTVFNARQLKLLNRMLDLGMGNFKGGINTRKYASFCKTSKPTASRELKSLVEKKCLIKRAGSAGRNISYDIVIP